jgi:quinol monooxygenase YgiN
MIRVIATIEVHSGRREEFLKIFHALVPHVRAEEGCREYGPMIDVPTSIGAQIPLRENVVTIVEQWDDLEALEAHLIAPHMLEYRKAVKDLVAGVTLQVLTPA